MTVSYSLDVSKARFCGLAQLLGRWKGGIYKIIWREFLIFCLAYTVLSVTYRCYLDESQKIVFEKVVIFVETFTDLIPLSFVLGFYVSLVIGRWWSQYETIPWPDRVAFTVSCYVHGADERSRMIRRTLVRYVILAKVLTFQAVSTSVKRRFPTTQHLVAAGLMNKAEKAVYDKLSFPYGKWWLPLHWFTALATRARKEGRIKDSVLLNGLFKEILDFRTSCAIMFGYDWISVPLVYTQVVTIATYAYSIALIVGRQYLDPLKGYPNHEVDLYVPFFTLLQFFFYIGWLKVAEQILNPYGEDDDDFELNWCFDRAVHLSYLAVDHLRMKHPKVEKDFFWDEEEPILPQTKQSANFFQPQLGSAFYLNVEDAEYLPMDLLFEEDEECNIYSNDSMKGPREGIRPSLLRRILSTGFGQSQKKRKSTRRRSVKNSDNAKGVVNPVFHNIPDKNNAANSNAPITNLNNSIKASSSHNRTSSMSFRPNSLDLHKRKSYDLQEAENLQLTSKNSDPGRKYSDSITEVTRTASAPAVAKVSDIEEDIHIIDSCLENDIEIENMPCIPEEASRATSLASIEANSLLRRNENPLEQLNEVHSLVKNANKMLLEMKTSISNDNQNKIGKRNYESCCSLDSSEEQENSFIPTRNETESSDVTVVIEMEKQRKEEPSAKSEDFPSKYLDDN